MGSDVSLSRGLSSQITDVQGIRYKILTQTLEHRCEMENICEMTSGLRATGASLVRILRLDDSANVPQSPCVPSTVPSVQSQNRTLRGDRCLSHIFQRNSRVLCISRRAHSHTSSTVSSAWIIAKLHVWNLRAYCVSASHSGASKVLLTQALGDGFGIMKAVV